MTTIPYEQDREERRAAAAALFRVGPDEERFAALLRSADPTDNRKETPRGDQDQH